MTRFAHPRPSTNKQDFNNQKLAILEHAQCHDLKLDEFLQISVSSHKSRRDRRIDELLDRLCVGDCLIVAEFSRLRRSTAEVILRVNELIGAGVRLAVKKAQGVQLGKPRGTIQESIYDQDRERIVELLGLGVPIAQIARRHLNDGTEGGLDYYMRTRALRKSLLERL